MSQQQDTPQPGSLAGVIAGVGGVVVTGGALFAGLYPAHGPLIVAFTGSVGTLLALTAAWLNHRTTQTLGALHEENRQAIAGVAQEAVALHESNREAIRDVAREAGTQVPAPAGKP